MEDVNIDQQIQDLNDTIELLTLDKEQLVLDKELLEEKLLQLQDENTALKQNVTSSQGIQILQEENQRLQEMLANVNDILKLEREKVKESQQKLSEAQTMLSTYKQQTEEQIQELLQQVDSLSQFESIIEKLTTENEGLKANIQEYKQTIQVLEDAAELNEELDDQQRRQIEADRKAIESYEVRFTHLEQKLVEKEVQNQELLKKLEQLKDTTNQLKQENQELHQVLSTESDQYQEMEGKLQLVQRYKQNIENLFRISLAIEQQVYQTSYQQYRYHLMTARYEQLFGNLSFTIEESKVMNTEVLLISIISLNFELQRQLVLLLSRGFPLQDQFQQLKEEESVHKVVMMLLQWLMVSMGLHQHFVHLALQFLYPAGTASFSNTEEELNINIDHQALLLTKNELEHFLQELILISHQVIPQQGVVLIEGEIPPGGESKKEGGNETQEEEKKVLSTITVITNKDAEQFYGRLMHYYHSFNRLTEQGSMDGSNKATNTPSSSPFLIRLLNDQTATDPLQRMEQEVRLETLVLIIPLIVESIQQSYGSSSESSTAGSSPLELCKSLKLELEQLLLVFTNHLSRHQVEISVALHRVYQICCQHFFNEKLGFFLYPTERSFSGDRDLQQQLKEMLTMIRQLNMQLQQSSSGSVVVPLKNESFITLQFYPIYSTVMARTTTTSINTPEEMKALQLNYYQLQEKYWKLFYQETTDLFPLPTSSNNSNSSEPAWKQRSTWIREQIAEKLFSVSKSMSYDEDLSPRTPVPTGTPSAVPITPSRPSRSTTTILKEKEQKIQELQHQLELKSKELVMTREKCLELQETVHQSMLQLEAVSTTVANVSSVEKQYQEEKAKLQQEIKTLEVALQTVEEKNDQLLKENRVLKASGGNPSATTSGSTTSAATTLASLAGISSTSGNTGSGKEKPIRKKTTTVTTGGEVTDAKAFLAALASKDPIVNKSVAAVSGSSTTSVTPSPVTLPSQAASATGRPALVDTEAEKFYQQEVQYWKSLATKNLLTSLQPLELNHPLLSSPATAEDQKEIEFPLTDQLTAKVPIRYDNREATLKKIAHESCINRIRAVKIKTLAEVVAAESDPTLSAEEAARRKKEKLQLLKSRKYLYYHEPLLFQLLRTDSK